MPDLEKQKVEQLQKINRNLEALTKVIRALGNRQSIINVMSGESLVPHRQFDGETGEPLDLDPVDHDYTSEDVQKHTPDPV